MNVGGYGYASGASEYETSGYSYADGGYGNGGYGYDGYSGYAGNTVVGGVDLVGAAFRGADVNNDGVIDRAEFSRIVQ